MSVSVNTHFSTKPVHTQGSNVSFWALRSECTTTQCKKSTEKDAAIILSGDNVPGPPVEAGAALEDPLPRKDSFPFSVQLCNAN